MLRKAHSVKRCIKFFVLLNYRCARIRLVRFQLVCRGLLRRECGSIPHDSGKYNIILANSGEQWHGLPSIVRAVAESIVHGGFLLAHLLNMESQKTPYNKALHKIPVAF